MGAHVHTHTHTLTLTSRALRRILCAGKIIVDFTALANDYYCVLANTKPSPRLLYNNDRLDREVLFLSFIAKIFASSRDTHTTNGTYRDGTPSGLRPGRTPAITQTSRPALKIHYRPCIILH